MPGRGGYSDERIDRDGAEAAIHLSKRLLRGGASGFLFGIMRRDGQIEIGFSGCLFDSPMLASGIASQLTAMVNDWHADEDGYCLDDI